MVLFSGRIPQRKRTPAASSDWLPMPFTVIYDDRERSGGWRFDGLAGDSSDKYRPLLIRTRERHMVTGDYTIETESGELLPVIIERKSHDDCIGSIGGGHTRLRAEHERMREIIDSGGHCCVVVESSLDKIIDELNSPDCPRQVSPAAVMGVVSSWTQHPLCIPWHFAGTRALAEQLAFRIMRNFYERRKNGN